MHVLVVTHFHSRVEIGDSSFIPFLHDGRLSRGSCLALKPLVSHLRYASQAIPIRSQYLCPDFRPHQGYSRQYHYTDLSELSDVCKLWRRPLINDWWCVKLVGSLLDACMLWVFRNCCCVSFRIGMLTNRWIWSFFFYDFVLPGLRAYLPAPVHSLYRSIWIIY